MNSIYRQMKHSGMAAIALTMLAAVVILAGIAIPAQAQTYPLAFPYPTTFTLNNAVSGSISDVQAAAVGDFTGDGKLDTVSMENGGGIFELDVAVGNGDGTFQYPLVQNLFSIGQQNPYAIAVGDFNGDHMLDVAVWGTSVTAQNSTINIFLGNGNGTFNWSGTYTAPNSATWNPQSNSLYVADFNGDGKLDLAALTPYNGVFIFMGNGDGTFQSGVGYSTVDPNHPNNYTAPGMAVGDLNGDGKLDIAVSESSGMAVLLNNGNGTFGTATYYDSGIYPFQTYQGIAIGDLNKDGKNDIVITCYYGQVLVYLNQGSGKFAVKGVVATLGRPSWLVTIADINGDKKPDLVVSDQYGEVFTFYGKGTGLFTAGPVYPLQVGDAAPTNLVLADFNGDGALDLFKAGDQYKYGLVMLGRGDGTFQSNQAYGWGFTGYGQNLVTADFNGDGFPDVAFSYARYSGQPAFGVMLGSSHGALAAPTYVTVGSTSCLYNLPEWVAAGDVNGDGKADIVATLTNYNTAGCANNQLAVLTGLGTGKFNKPVLYSTGATAQSYEVFLADVNGDGKPDIVTSNADGTISVLLNKGTGTFGPAVLTSSLVGLGNPYGNSLTVADFNGDGKADIAVANYGWNSSNGNGVFVLLGNGDGTFKAPITVTAAPQYSYTYALAAGDFNKDGKTDLLVTITGQCPADAHGYAAYAFLQGHGDGTFTAGPMNCTGGNDPMYPVVADLNGDGKLDAFIPLLQSETNIPLGPVLLEGNGDGTFNRIGKFYVGDMSPGAVVADFNGDGMPDLAVLNNDQWHSGAGPEFVTVMQNSTQPVSVSPLIVNYGAVAVGASKALTVILANDQSALLAISGITVGGADPEDFTAKSACGSSLKAGWDCTITVTAKPTVAGARTATLSINDAVGTQTVQLVIPNPVPTVTSISPSSAIAGSAGFTLTVNGKNFVTTSVVNWAGSPRTTTFVSATQITATINAADIAKGGTFKVTVTNPAPGGGTSAASNFVVDNPVPTLTSISPSSATHGGAAFKLTATGTGYDSVSVIEWNGKKLTTTYVSGTTLTATVPAADIKTAGTASVTVVNPTPGGGTSAAQTFTIN
ncbi:MAG: FG-GAP-like repeat-containing protein [Terriglobales bacterium]